MANTLQAGAVAVNIIGNDAQFQQTINQVNASVQKFQTNIQNGITKMPGFKEKGAWFRDFVVTFAAVDHLARSAFSYISSAFRTAINDISTFGDTYAKMSRRVGMGAKDLSLLGYAAELGVEFIKPALITLKEHDSIEKVGRRDNKLVNLAPVDLFLWLFRRFGNVCH